MVGQVTLITSGQRVQVFPDTALRYYPGNATADVIDTRLQAADRLEFGQQALERAASLLEGLANADPATRAGALVRLARIRRKQGRQEDALSLYRELTTITGASVQGVPAALLGLYGQCEILGGQDSKDLLGEAAVELAAALSRGGHPITKTTYLFYVQSAVEWLDRSGNTDAALRDRLLANAHTPSEAAIMLFRIRDDLMSGAEASEGIRSARIDSDLVVLQWVGSEGAFAGRISSAAGLQNGWINEAQAPGRGLSISDDSGNLLLAVGTPSDNILATRTLASAGQSWTLTSYLTDAFPIDAANRSRRRILLAILLLVIVMVAASTHFLSRAMRREVAVAKLQSDFVSAVSHELRTPLTSMRQITEMLSSGRVPSPDKQREYYADLDTDARRLSRLVEGLLNFGRMEAGGFPYVFEPRAIGDLVRETVAEFRHELSLGETELRLMTDANPMCDLDQETFRLALWNLLDNALKYSEGKPDITVTVASRESEAIVSIADTGPGIPKADQAQIFDKFVRGSDARKAGVKGTGLGLALVKTIMADHGGRVMLESELGAGSTFTLVLPLHAES
jgi:signal transduction histidine kinase